MVEYIKNLERHLNLLTKKLLNFKFMKNDLAILSLTPRPCSSLVAT